MTKKKKKDKSDESTEESLIGARHIAKKKADKGNRVAKKIVKQIDRHLKRKKKK